MAEPKQTNKERLREITESIEQGIKELFESEKYMQYLRVMSRYHIVKDIGIIQSILPIKR